jgi:S-adenosylmethionine-diacylgycerolhomoserine-N-methlytransferase
MEASTSQMYKRLSAVRCGAARTPGHMTQLRATFADVRSVWHLMTSPGTGENHQARLNQFYDRQASSYDRFRRRMLHGRQQLIDMIPLTRDAVWVDFGCGTAENLERFGQRINQFKQIHLVDLCEPLLKVAKKRCAQLATEVPISIYEADVTQFELPESSVDLITFSYSLTMIPEWIAAIENAHRLLRPGGLIAVVDFFVSRKHAPRAETQHRWITRTGWPVWFAWDNVYLESERLAFLQRRFRQAELQQLRGALPFIPILKVPYYLFVGRKS